MIYLKLFWNFLIVGCFSFGGGYAMLPLIDRQVTSQGWMTTEQLTDVIAVSGMLPGSVGVNAATCVGYETAGLFGAIVATIGMVLPSLLIITFFGVFFHFFVKSQTFEQVLYGLGLGMSGLMLSAGCGFAL